MGYSALAFIIVIGILVFIHEFGHFIVARICGVGVEVFSLGFGPKILQKRYKRTLYCICVIPLGGYVKMVGEDPSTKTEEIHESFTHKSLFKRTLIVSAGPFFNFFLAAITFYFLYQFSGIYLTKPIVGDLVKDSPAFSANLQKGDIIKQIDNKQIEAFEDIAKIVQASNGRQLTIIVQRDNNLFNIALSPVLKPSVNIFGEKTQIYVIGIIGTKEYYNKHLNLFSAFGYSIKETFKIIKLTILSVVKIIRGKISSDNIGGPLMIAQMAGEQAKAGVVNFAWFVALLSVNLGIINLLPIPLLDGGHLLFFLIEGITGKPVSAKLRERLIQIGAALLITLMIFVFYNDILRIFNGG